MTKYEALELAGIALVVAGLGLLVWALMAIAFWLGIGAAGLVLILAGILVVGLANRGELR